jgi:5-amino-6-(5-phosphoribosylamino)uracil reductase
MHTTVILAISVDGKIADRSRSAARFGSDADRRHLEQQVSQADAVLFGAATLRAYGTTMSVRDPDLLHQRELRGQPVQPIQIVCSGSGQLDRSMRFFSQPVPRWLLTDHPDDWGKPEFDRVLKFANWPDVWEALKHFGVDRLAVLGGGQLVAGLLAAGLVDELRLTICPLIFGGNAVSPVAGAGWLESVAPRLNLLECLPVGDEVFLHYQIHPRPERLP